MKPFNYHGDILERSGRLGDFCRLPRCCQSISSQGPSTSTTNTGTTSGQSSPVASEGSQAIGSGSIGVGTNSKYLEEGATDNANANQSTNISAGGNSSVTIGDTNAASQISQLAQQFASAIENVSASDASGVQAAVQGNQSGFSWSNPLVIVGIAVVAILGVFFIFGKRS